MKRKQIHVPEQLDQDIVNIAKLKGLKPAEIYRRALEIGLKEMKKIYKED